MNRGTDNKFDRMHLDGQGRKPTCEDVFWQPSLARATVLDSTGANAASAKSDTGNPAAVVFAVPLVPALPLYNLATGTSENTDLTATIKVEVTGVSAKTPEKPARRVWEQTAAWPNPSSFATPRGYHIPLVEYERAARATPPDRSAYWQYDMFEGPGQQRKKVKLHYCDTKEAMEEVARLFLGEEVIGFDMEWKIYSTPVDGIKKNVSLIQIATDDRIALFHLAHFPNAEKPEDFVSPSLEKILMSPDITKVGACVMNDGNRLQKFLGIEPRGLFELSNLHKLVMYCRGKIEKLDRKKVALAKQALEHFGLPVLKDEVRCSDWTRRLSPKQTLYAATDPYANLLLYYIMDAKRMALNPTPPRPAHAELKQRILLDEQTERITDFMKVFECSCMIRSDNAAGSPAAPNTNSPITHSPDCSRNQRKSNRSADPNTHSFKGPPSRRRAPRADKSPSKSPRQRKPVNPAYTAQFEKANKFFEQNRDPNNKYLPPRVLLAYSFWHEQKFDVDTIARLLHNPPIQKTTVVGYLYDALANLPERLHCAPYKIVDITERYAFLPYNYAHKKVLDTAKAKIRQTEAANVARRYP